MVKTCIIVVIVISLILSLGFLEHRIINSYFDFLKDNLIAMLKLANEDYYPAQLVSNLENEWHKKEKILHIVIPHRDIQDIKIYLSKLSTGFDIKSYEMVCENANILLTLSDEIPHTYEFNFQNIF